MRRNMNLFLNFKIINNCASIKNSKCYVLKKLTSYSNKRVIFFVLIIIKKGLDNRD